MPSVSKYSALVTPAMPAMKFVGSVSTLVLSARTLAL